jgi:TonB family protein
MRREHSTPLILWICAAVCAHIIFGEGGEQVAVTHEDHSFLKHMATQIRERVRDSEQTFEVGTVSTSAAPEEKPPEPPPEKQQIKEEKKKDPVVEKKKDEPLPPKPEQAKPKAEVKVVVKEEDPAKKLEQPPQLMKDKRIAVQQHAEKNQQDNPDAKFVADEANHVKEESVATITSHDQDDKNPTPGGSHSGPQGAPGDSDKTRIADSEEHKGETNRRPGEKGTEFDVQKEPMPTKPMGPVAVQAQPANQPPRAGGDGRTPQEAKAASEPQIAPGGASPPSPEVAQGAADSNWSFNPTRSGMGIGSAATPGSGQNPKTAQSPGSTKWLGLGGQVGPGQININLTQQGVVAVVGQDELRKEREADGERRRSEHRGSWQASNFERWRNAIENYVSSVKPGNQTALNTAAVPFATYLHSIHNRIHPIFADNFLGSLDSLPKDHPLNNQKLITKLEIVLSREGRIIKMGIVKGSGMTMFDIAALDSVQRASPFGPAPQAIVSGDGNVYLHWEFWRNEVYACSTMNASPFILNNAPPAQPPGGLPPVGPPGNPERQSPTQERGAPPPVNIDESRQGTRDHENNPLHTGAPG